jgi:hypothetical protein
VVTLENQGAEKNCLAPVRGKIARTPFMFPEKFTFIHLCFIVNTLKKSMKISNISFQSSISLFLKSINYRKAMAWKTSVS